MTVLHKTQDLWFDLSPVEDNQSCSKAHYIFYDLASSVHTAVIIIFIIFVFLIQPAFVSGESMLPTLQNKDVLIILNNRKAYNRGDIVVIAPYEKSKSSLVKRIVAVGGDVLDIDFSSGTVTLNGQVLDEPYIKEPTLRSFDVTFPLTVPEGCVFVMGDNRNNSLDSRHSDVGFVNENYILGKAEFRLYPFGKHNIYENKESRVNNGQ